MHEAVPTDGVEDSIEMSSSTLAQIRADEALARDLQAQMAEETPLMRALWHQRSHSGAVATAGAATGGVGAGAGAVPAGVGLGARPPAGIRAAADAALMREEEGESSSGSNWRRVMGGQYDRLPRDFAAARAADEHDEADVEGSNAIAADNDANANAGAAAGGAGAAGQGARQQQVPVRMNVAARAFDQQRLFVMLLVLVNTPQVLAAIVVLSMHWKDDSVCDAAHRNNWRLWATVQAARLALHAAVSVALLSLGPDPAAPARGRSLRVRRARQRAAALLQSAKSGLEAVGLVWFIMGNMYLFSADEGDGSCEHPEKSAVYRLCVGMIVVSYIQLCAPCLLAILMIPVLCFCLPCLIRLLNSLTESAGLQRGASANVIDRIPLVKYSDQREGEIEETACPICLGDYEPQDMLRLLPCKHAFHRACVDDWLRLNATCPNCRAAVGGGSDNSAQDLDDAEEAENAAQNADIENPAAALRPPRASEVAA